MTPFSRLAPGGREGAAFAVLAGIATLTLIVQVLIALGAVSELERDAEAAATDAVESAAAGAAVTLYADADVAETSALVIAREIDNGLISAEPRSVLDDLLVQVATKDELRAMLVAFPDGRLAFVRREGDGWVTTTTTIATDGTGYRERLVLDSNYREVSGERGPVELEPSDRAWYTSALNIRSGEAAWSDPELGSVTSDSNVWVSSPVRGADGRVEVVVAAGLLLDPLSTVITDLPIREAGGEAFILAGDSTVVAAPRVYQEAIDAYIAENGAAPHASDLGLAPPPLGRAGASIATPEGNDSIEFHRRLTAAANLDWTLYIRADRAAIAPNATRLENLVTALAAWLTLTAIVLGVLLFMMRRRAARSYERGDTDALTGTSNRFKLQRDASRLVTRAVRGDKVAVVAVLDLDNLKAVNDERGHGKGDQALKAVGRSLIASTRPQDIVARFGGDEFVVVFEAAEGADPWAAVERIRREATAAVRIVAGDGVGMTAGFAVCAPAYLEEFDNLFDAADERLVAGKRASKGTTYGPS